MTTKDSRANDEAEIRTLIGDWTNALRGKDADGVVAHYAADNSMFVLAPPLQYTRDNSPTATSLASSSYRPDDVTGDMRDLALECESSWVDR